MSKPYRVCPHCGDHLDPGELCTCLDAYREAAKQPTPEAGMEAGQQATGNPHRPVLVPGA